MSDTVLLAGTETGTKICRANQRVLSVRPFVSLSTALLQAIQPRKHILGLRCIVPGPQSQVTFWGHDCCCYRKSQAQSNQQGCAPRAGPNHHSADRHPAHEVHHRFSTPTSGWGQMLCSRRVLTSDRCWFASPDRHQGPESTTASTHLALSPDGSLNDSLLIMLLLLPLLCALGSPKGHSKLTFAVGAQCGAAARRLHLRDRLRLPDWYGDMQGSWAAQYPNAQHKAPGTLSVPKRIAKPCRICSVNAELSTRLQGL